MGFQECRIRRATGQGTPIPWKQVDWGELQWLMKQVLATLWNTARRRMLNPLCINGAAASRDLGTTISLACRPGHVLRYERGPLQALPDPQLVEGVKAVRLHVPATLIFYEPRW